MEYLEHADNYLVWTDAIAIIVCKGSDLRRNFDKLKCMSYSTIVPF